MGRAIRIPNTYKLRISETTEDGRTFEAEGEVVGFTIGEAIGEADTILPDEFPGEDDSENVKALTMSIERVA